MNKLTYLNNLSLKSKKTTTLFLEAQQDREDLEF